jgi:intein/homing endonuclease
MKLIQPNIKYAEYLDMTQFFPKEEYYHWTEIEKAIEYCKLHGGVYTITESQLERGNGIEYILPAIAGSTIRKCVSGVDNTLCPGKIHTYKKRGKAGMPERMKLTKEFGTFVGAFVAEGCSEYGFISITNNDIGFRKHITDFVDTLGMTHSTKTMENKNGVGWTSTSINITSTMLSTFMRETCGYLSQNKKVPNYVYTANDDFVRGFLCGYFSGDGCVRTDRSVTAQSISEDLIDGIAILLARFDIFTTKRKGKPSSYKGKVSPHPAYVITLRNENINRFAKEISSIVDYKKERLDNYMKEKMRFNYSLADKIPGINVRHISS